MTYSAKWLIRPNDLFDQMTYSAIWPFRSNGVFGQTTFGPVGFDRTVFGQTAFPPWSDSSGERSLIWKWRVFLPATDMRSITFLFDIVFKRKLHGLLSFEMNENREIWKAVSIFVWSGLVFVQRLVKASHVGQRGLSILRKLLNCCCAIRVFRIETANQCFF